MITREEQSHVHRHAPQKIASSIADAPSLVPGILMNNWRRLAFSGSAMDCATVFFVSYARSGETSSDTKPSTPACSFVNRTEQIGGARQILHSQLKEQLFAGKAGPHEPANLRIVRFAMSDSVVEDRRIGGQPRDRKIVDVAFSVPLSSSSRVMLSSQML